MGKNEWRKEDEEHFKFLRKHGIGEKKSKVMAKEMTNIDARDKKKK